MFPPSLRHARARRAAAKLSMTSVSMDCRAFAHRRASPATEYQSAASARRRVKPGNDEIENRSRDAIRARVLQTRTLPARRNGAPGGARVVNRATRANVTTRSRFGRGARHRTIPLREPPASGALRLPALHRSSRRSSNHRPDGARNARDDSKYYRIGDICQGKGDTYLRSPASSTRPSNKEPSRLSASTARSSLQPPCRALSKNFCSISARVSGSFAPPRM